MLVIGAKGLRQMTKTRWFVYEQKLGKLKYYKDEKDEQSGADPIGDINVTSATFRYDLSADDNGTGASGGEFTIW